VYRYVVIALIAATAAVSSGAAAAAPVATGEVGEPTAAVYGSETLDLSEDWGTAGACIELGDTTACYATEAELLAAHPDVHGGSSSLDRAGAAVATAAITCSSSLRLYDGTWHTGGILYLSTRGVFHNLSNFGFDNVTSSYRIGACSAAFFSLANGGGSVYPGYTGAWAQYASMVSGWSNVVSSVYIY
jgi:hypothetical protein